jgi:hypothetical protein
MRDTHADTQTGGRNSDTMTYIPSFIKIGSGIQKLIGGIHRQHGDRISLLLFLIFLQNKESRMKTKFQTHTELQVKLLLI